MRDLIALITLLGSGAASLLGVWWRMELRIRNVESAALTRDVQIEKEIAQFQREVAKDYPTFDALKDVERRLSERLETIAEKVDEMPGQVVDRITQFLVLKSGNQGNSRG